MVEEVQGVLLVPAGMLDGRGTGQLQKPVDDALVFLQCLRDWLPNTLSVMRVRHH